MQWTKKSENYYAVLSNHGNLYYGAGQDPLKNVMDDVDACKFNCFLAHGDLRRGFSSLSMITVLSPCLCSLAILYFQQYLAGHFIGMLVLHYHLPSFFINENVEVDEW